MKKLISFAVAAMLLCYCLGFVGCKPEPPDTSAVAGTYYQHEGNTLEGAQITGKWIKLQADGVWTTVEDTRNSGSGTFMLKENNQISLYYGNVEVMYGTIDNGKLTLQVWNVVNWIEAVFYKE